MAETNNNLQNTTKETPVASKKEESTSWWDNMFSEKEPTEAAKKQMENIFTQQEQELALVISEYKQGKTDIVGKSNQQKAELLADVSKTLATLNNNRDINGIQNEYQSVAVAAYENLEAKITGTKETVDFNDTELYPEFIEKAIANLEKFKQELSAVSIESIQTESEEVKESTHLSDESNNNSNISNNLSDNKNKDINQKLIDVKIANQEKKDKVDDFKTKNLDEMKQMNDEYITNHTESLEEKLSSTTDAEMKKKIERLLSSYMSVQELIKSTRTSSENSSESQKKEQEVSIYENNLYALNKKTEQIQGTKTVEETVEEPTPAIITPATSTPTVTVESIPNEILPPKDFFEDIKFSEKKGVWPTRERETAVNEIKKINNTTELSNALQPLLEKKNYTVNDILLVQIALTKLGYNPGVIDGVYKDSKEKTSNTIKAVKEFQEESGLARKGHANGQIGPKTIGKMIEVLRVKEMEVPIETPENTPLEIQTTTPENTPEDTTENTPEDTTENTPEDTTENTPEDTTEEGGLTTTTTELGNETTILTTGEITPLNRTEKQGREQFEKEQGNNLTKDETTGEYTGSSKTRWENSPYNPKSKKAEEYRVMALNNLFTAGGDSAKKALNYMSEHPEDPAVVRLDAIIKEINDSEQKSTIAPLSNDTEPVEALPVKEEEVTIPEVKKPIESPTPEVVPSVNTSMKNTTPESRGVTLEDFKALQLKVYDQISFETNTGTIRTGVYQMISKTAVGTEIKFRDEYDLRSFFLEDMKPGTLKKIKR
ncbi:MAG: peptidoglycan-binding domain-containing protein [Candidatus Gracilibacteria bacterium]|nr:peptidoglycan-binding domain-containing protein [Candidatus Gracilibacteria bacterium]